MTITAFVYQEHSLNLWYSSLTTDNSGQNVPFAYYTSTHETMLLVKLNC